MDMTPQQFTQMQADDRLTQVLCALIQKRVTTSSVIQGGSTQASAARLVADAKAIVAELNK